MKMHCLIHCNNKLQALPRSHSRKLSSGIGRLVSSIFIVLLVPFQANAEPWSLRRAIDTAVANNPDLQAALIRVVQAEAMLEEANAMGMPRLSLNGSYSQTDSPMMAFGSILNQRSFDFDLNFNNPGTIDNLSAKALVGIPLYTGGRLSSGKRAAKAGIQAAEFDEVSARHQLMSQTVMAYLNILKTGEAVSAIEAGVKAYESAVENSRLRYEAGQVLKSDLLSLEVQLARTREQLVEAKHFRALAERAFLFVLGLPADHEPVTVNQEDPSLSALVEPATLNYQARPEIRALLEREQAGIEIAAAAEGARKPSVSAFASYQFDRGWKTDGSGNSWLAGVAVDLNVFDGGSNKARVKQAEARLAELREYLRKTELAIGLEVEKARLALELARDRVAVTELSQQQAEESASLSRARFEEGALLTAELIGVESRLIEARMRRVVAKADELIAIAELRRAVGFFPIEN